jgi:integrase
MLTEIETKFDFTEARLAKARCPEGKSQLRVYDAKVSGLAYRVRKSGAKAFQVCTTRPGMKGTHYVTLKQGLDLAQARAEAKRLIGEAARPGADLIAAVRERKQAAKAAADVATIGMLLAEDGPYEADMKARGLDPVNTIAMSLSSLRRNLLPAHKNTDVRKLELLDITGIMAKLTNGAASDFRKNMTTFLNAMRRLGYIRANVLLGYKQPQQGRKNVLARKAKGRALTDDEIVKVWNAAGKRGAFGQLVRLYILGGPRRTEPTHMEWKKHVKEDRITFDPNWTKMGRHHDIPRSELVEEVLAAAKHFQRAQSDYVFPSAKTGGRIAGFSKLVPKLVKEAGTAHWTPHDLRRSLRTVMSKCGYDDAIQRLCVGQKAPHLDQIYNFDEQWAIRRMAFESAHAYFAALLKGDRVDNVVRLERAQNPKNAMKIKLLNRLREHHEQVG